MGYGGFARFRAVDLPLAVPVIAAGLRVAAVSNVSIVSVASLIGISQLGYFLTDGYARSLPDRGVGRHRRLPAPRPRLRPRHPGRLARS